MLNSDSPIKDMFPIGFIEDANGKIYEFENIVLLPNIDLVLFMFY